MGILAVFLAVACGAARAGILTSKHNLSVSGPGTVTAESETRVCIFCHTPHNASPAAQLWNRNASTATYTPYTSTSMNAAPGQPTGSSKLCLSCHDGTIALGEVLSETVPISMVGGVTTMPSGPTNLGVLLLDDHPVSFVYGPGLPALDPQLADPSTLTGDVKLDDAGELQCSTCHEAHDDTFGDFLVTSNLASAICQTCHVRTYWDPSTHRSSTATWNGIPPDPWPHTDFLNVTDNACESCHNPHNAGGAERLLNYGEEELNCYACHNTNVASTDVEAEFQKLYAHPVTATTGVHDAVESALVTTRHAECVDCHNPHAAEATTALAPAVSGRLKGVLGIDSGGLALATANNEYEVCYRCHADSPGKPGPATPRLVIQDNVRLEFDPANPSYHPIETPGANPDVPSLLPPLSTGSMIYCTDCHNSDAGPRAGGTGPDGPHGSIYPALLGWNYETGDPSAESPTAYELCYRCHDRTSLLNDDSFKEHKKHVQSVNASCNVCHDPHGIDAAQVGTGDHTHLINFDVTVVQPEPNSGRLEFIDSGTFKGECWLKCHNVKHSPKNY